MLTNRMLMAFIFGVVFSISYHAAYIPAALAAAVLVAGLYRKDQLAWKTALLGGFGLLVGLIINPYFPSNLVRAMQTLALGMNLSNMPEFIRVRIGMELMPLAFSQMATVFVPTFALLVFSLWICRKKYSILPFFGFAILLWIASFRSPRAGEFIAPFAVGLVAIAWQEKKWIGNFLMAGLLALNIFFMAKDGGYLARESSNEPLLETYNRLLDFIPVGKTPTMVFHDRWDYSSYTIFLRPDLQVAEVLDPTYLWLQNPAQAELVSVLLYGQMGKPAQVIREAFHADYALAQGPLASQLSKDPHAELIAHLRRGAVSLFRLKP
ncbi:MAG: hypothetical protein EOP11_03250 [Proteobacteria bacterium]|nr:MAG: hypothetical protein EOP11_03250 [Pseudomonadota bacterium]